MHTNNTSHYNLPQFIGSDVPNPLTDWNDSMQDIDTAMYEIKTQADEIGADVVQDETNISNLQSQANLTDDNITLLNQQTTAARTAATDAQDAANRNASNIATLQQSVTNNRTSITQYNNRFNQNVPFAFGIEEVEDPDNPGTMIEKYGFYTNDDPSEFVPFGEASEKSMLLAVISAASSTSSSWASNQYMTQYSNAEYFTINGNVITCAKACKKVRALISDVTQSTCTIQHNNVSIASVTGNDGFALSDEFDVEQGDTITLSGSSNPAYTSASFIFINNMDANTI